MAYWLAVSNFVTGRKLENSSGAFPMIIQFYKAEDYSLRHGLWILSSLIEPRRFDGGWSSAPPAITVSRDAIFRMVGAGLIYLFIYSLFWPDPLSNMFIPVTISQTHCVSFYHLARYFSCIKAFKKKVGTTMWKKASVGQHNPDLNSCSITLKPGCVAELQSHKV